MEYATAEAYNKIDPKHLVALRAPACLMTIERLTASSADMGSNAALMDWH